MYKLIALIVLIISNIVVAHGQCYQRGYVQRGYHQRGYHQNGYYQTGHRISPSRQLTCYERRRIDSERNYNHFIWMKERKEVGDYWRDKIQKNQNNERQRLINIRQMRKERISPAH